jgi:hypothetical protein
MKTKCPVIKIRANVFIARGQKVVPADAAADFYGVTSGVLMRAIARNEKRFPKELMFRLTPNEIAALPAFGKKFLKTLPVFTETGVAMLSTVLKSPKPC